jgi:hypothetical protein
VNEAVPEAEAAKERNQSYEVDAEIDADVDAEIDAGSRYEN